MSEIAASGATSLSKWRNNGEITTSNSHEYTLCLLGDWAPINITRINPILSPTRGNPSEVSAVHEVSVHLDSPIVQVSCGSGWSCLLCEDGRACSLGDSTYGQLGQSHERPVHGGFVLDVGELYMFGCGSYGRLGTGNEANTNVPTLVAMKWSALLAANIVRKPTNNSTTDEDEDEVRFKEISCGDRHTLTLAVRITRANSDSWSICTKTKTSIISFGDGMNGRLGLGDEKDRHEGAFLSTWLAASSAPGIGIPGNNGYMAPPTVTAICAGSTHNLALTASGYVFSWGNGVDGQLGHGAAVSEWVPRQLDFFKDLSISDICCGTSHSMAVSRSGVVYTWGREAEGQLGIDLEENSTVGVWVPHPVTILKSATHRVTVRSIVAKHNMSLVLDDKERVFVWGDNALGQLGMPESGNTTLGTKSVLSKPKQLSYMDLRASKPAACNLSTSISCASSLRELVAAAKPDPIRLGLTHLDAGNGFTMFVFATKPGIGTTTNAFGGEISAPVASEAFPETKTIARTWNFSLTDELPISAIPSRESAYFEFMANYKVYLRPAIPRRRDDTEEEDEMDRIRNMQRPPPYRRGRKGSTTSKRGSVPTMDPNTPFSTTNEDYADNTSACNSQAQVQGVDDIRVNPSLKTIMTRHSFNSAASTPSKEEEVKRATPRINDTPTKPQKSKSGLYRSFSNRRPTVSTRNSVD
ncbi:Regulator of chromosome condensation (RCC1) repeat [Phytophthora infestans]|uniref:Regulator of chromosome condensation (RCC1) repeat n=1 Tax=Phytophthora infestans TaxID=4787 RepID=A0A8S9TR10_PHYIN|nr:Regulator of chromosome condensation (RCC1) repeat [Phytophthora infestans]